jgi:hypothetical protein
MKDKLEDYQAHIIHPHQVDRPGEAICGAHISGTDWRYVAIGHAFLSAPEGLLHLCPKCAAVIVSVFRARE